MSVPSSLFRRRWIPLLLVLALVAAGVWYFASPQPRSANNRRGGPNPAWAGTGPSPAMPVRVVRAARRDLPVYLKAIGTVVPLNTVTVRSRVDGPLLRVAFIEGQHVERGQLLAEIDPASYRIRLAQTEGQLQQNLAQLGTARADLARLRELFDRNLVTRQELETQEALVQERQGAVAVDQAAVDEAKLQLSYTRIEAPISGRVGLRRVDAGNLIQANSSEGLVVITETQTVAVTFTVPEHELENIVTPLRAGEELAVEAWDRSERTLLARGVLRTVDNQIDLATGTLRLKAEFANKDERLFPNQFVNVRLRVRTVKDALVIPAAAVQFGSRGTYVFVVNDQSQSEVRDIALGPSDGVDQVVTRGLEPGEPVVVEGIDRLRDGRKVVVVEAAAPASAQQAAGAP